MEFEKDGRALSGLAEPVMASGSENGGRPSADAQPQAGHPTDGSGAPAGDKLRVLIVEDEALILMMAVDMVEDLGHEALTANTAASAIALLGSDQRVDVMITDINLPDTNGEVLAEEARRLRPMLPVVFATGHRMNVPEKLAGTGPTAVLGKPYWMNELEKSLRQVC